MIQANELRIGNYVLNDEGDWFCVNADFIVNTERNSNWGSPIPLTPEILERCGFNIDGNGLWIHETDSLVNDFSLEYDKSEKNNFIPTINRGEYSAGIAIKYLHQLQNKYFDWYGEELEIKL